MNLKMILKDLNEITRHDDELLINEQNELIKQYRADGAYFPDIAEQLQTDADFTTAQSLCAIQRWVPYKNAVVNKIKILGGLEVERLQKTKAEIVKLIEAYQDECENHNTIDTESDAVGGASVLEMIQKKMHPIYALNELNRLYELLKNGVPSSFYHDVIAQEDENSIAQFQSELMSTILYLIPKSDESCIMTKIPVDNSERQFLRSSPSFEKILESIHAEIDFSKENIEKINHAVSQTRAFSNLSDLCDVKRRQEYISKDEQPLLQTLKKYDSPNSDSQDRINVIRERIASHRSIISQMEDFNHINFSQNSTELNASAESSSEPIELIDFNGNPYDYHQMKIVFTQNGFELESGKPVTIKDIYHMISFMNQCTNELKLKIEKLEDEQARLESVETDRLENIKRIQTLIHEARIRNFQKILTIYLNLQEEIKRKELSINKILEIIRVYAGDSISSEIIKLVNFGVQNTSDYGEGIETVDRASLIEKISEYCVGANTLSISFSNDNTSILQLEDQSVILYLKPEVFETLIPKILGECSKFLGFSQIAEDLFISLQHDINTFPSLQAAALTRLGRETFVFEALDCSLKSQCNDIDHLIESKQNHIHLKDKFYNDDGLDSICDDYLVFIKRIKSLNKRINTLYVDYENAIKIQSASERRVELEYNWIQASSTLEDIKRKWPQFIKHYCQLKFDHSTNKTRSMDGVMSIFDEFYSYGMKRDMNKKELLQTRVSSVENRTIHEHIHELILNIEKANLDQISLRITQSSEQSTQKTSDSCQIEPLGASSAEAGPSGENRSQATLREYTFTREKKSGFRYFYESCVLSAQSGGPRHKSPVDSLNLNVGMRRRHSIL